MRVQAATIGELFGAILAADARPVSGEVLLRKGIRLGEDHRSALAGLNGLKLHVVDLEPAELDQDAAAGRLAEALAGHGTRAAPPEHGQVRIQATRRGLLRVRAEAVRAVNGLPPLLLFTWPDGHVVVPGDEVAGAKSAALGTPEPVLARAEALLGKTPAIVVAPFVPRRVAVVVTDRLPERGRELVAAAVRRKIEWFDSTVTAVSEVPHQTDAVAAALRDAIGAGADLVLISGGNPLDPLDHVLVALRTLGGDVVRAGVPAHPGSMVWAGQLGSVVVLGVATCAGFGRATAFDLVLARLLAGEEVTHAVESIGAGGLLDGASGTPFPPYDRG